MCEKAVHLRQLATVTLKSSIYKHDSGREKSQLCWTVSENSQLVFCSKLHNILWVLHYFKAWQLMSDNLIGFCANTDFY